MFGISAEGLNNIYKGLFVMAGESAFFKLMFWEEKFG
jgi:hypothetical protein